MLLLLCWGKNRKDPKNIPRPQQVYGNSLMPSHFHRDLGSPNCPWSDKGSRLLAAGAALHPETTPSCIGPCRRKTVTNHPTKTSKVCVLFITPYMILFVYMYLMYSVPGIIILSDDSIAHAHVSCMYSSSTRILLYQKNNHESRKREFGGSCTPNRPTKPANQLVDQNTWPNHNI